MPQSLAASHRLPRSNVIETPIINNNDLITEAIGFIIEKGPQSYRRDPDTDVPIPEEPKDFLSSSLSVYKGLSFSLSFPFSLLLFLII